MEREVSKRDLQVVTISFGGPVNDPAQHKIVVEKAREAMRFLQGFGAKHLVVFPPGRMKPGQDVDAGFRAMCKGFNRIGEAANEMGFQAGVHNHLDEMVQGPEEVDRCMAMTDPKLFNFAPDTAHLHLGGCDVVKMFEKYKDRLVFMDYKDARWTTPAADLVSAQRPGAQEGFVEGQVLREHVRSGRWRHRFPRLPSHPEADRFQGWICVDLDRTRNGPRASYEHCGEYMVNKLEPIYV